MKQTYKPFSQRVATITPNILGYRLLPLSLGHMINLKESKSKFATGEYDSFLDINNIVKALKTDANVIPEFIFAVLVCSNTYDEFKDECGSGSILTTIKQLKKDIKHKDINILLEIHSFAHYLHNGTTNLPDYIVKDKDKISAAPMDFEEAVIDVLISNTTLTRYDCYNLPITETVATYINQAYKNDAVDLVSKDLAEAMESLKK